MRGGPAKQSILRVPNQSTSRECNVRFKTSGVKAGANLFKSREGKYKRLLSIQDQNGNQQHGYPVQTSDDKRRNSEERSIGDADNPGRRHNCDQHFHQVSSRMIERKSGHWSRLTSLGSQFPLRQYGSTRACCTSDSRLRQLKRQQWTPRMNALLTALSLGRTPLTLNRGDQWPSIAYAPVDGSMAFRREVHEHRESFVTFKVGDDCEDKKGYIWGNGRFAEQRSILDSNVSCASRGTLSISPGYLYPYRRFAEAVDRPASCTAVVFRPRFVFEGHGIRKRTRPS